ncbi:MULTISPECIES: hypothetical protein [unclassified Beijerinckia]|uniref:hypothetical protein n=1 Tax=unclassified Beijerinckia TaxID=2638183 RepID=UPI0008996501|nr:MULTISPECIES: hypothetical protein [unclassified Beijerinckia]MDH7796380.1 hypothetical protein [Beijerinckia sp. GAS462]SEC42682.1 hypothetical protein SAMN05443249_2663 [Beijerinckia sp. 28-YEA-48]
MIVNLEISPATLSELFSSAIEGGDPVTTASRGGWCDGIYWRRRKHRGDYWYSEPETFAGAILIDVIEVDDEQTGHKMKHRLDERRIATGLKAMAERFPGRFAQIFDGNIDAPCADAFLQACVFGEEKYA